ncbi:MAG: ElyC/SanA/YdcF family protein [Lachnospiraceae bacterium]|nr:ElyC/SanA/YdcF family protein [Lachnospiraceae bacterium]
MKKINFDNLKTAPADVVILGAKLFDDGSIPPILSSRLKAAAAMWQIRSDLTFYLVGDIDDTKAMQTALLEDYHLPSDALRSCPKGTTTFAALKACLEDLKLSSVLLLTSTFHQKRAAYIAGRLGLHYEMFDMTLFETVDNHYYDRREQLAMVKARFETGLYRLRRRAAQKAGAAGKKPL